MQNIKAKIFALPPAILFLIGITILGSAITGGVYIFKATRNICAGADCVPSTAFTPFQFTEPEKIPQIEDVCGDDVCGGNEELYQNVCPRDCGGVATPPTIETFAATPEIINAGKTVTLSWSSDAIFCAPGDDGTPWGRRWPGGAPKGEITTDPLSSSQIYSIACMSKNGGISTKSVIVSVIQPPPPPAPIIKNNTDVTLTARPETINSGETAKLSWVSINATNCSASGDGESWGWSGIRPTSGTQTTPPLTSNQTYIIKCTGRNGSSSKKITVNVSSTATAPSISFSTIPTTVPYGGKATLAWRISNANSCITSNSGSYPEWTGVLPLKSLSGGLKTTPPLTSTGTFTITCTNGAGGSTATTTKNVTILVSEALGCIAPGGKEIPSGSSIEAYLTSSVAYGGTCVSETRNCLNGKLSGSYPNGSCKPVEARDCSLDGTTIKSGESITAYKTPEVKDTACISETRTCTNGTLSGSGSYWAARCTANCTTPWSSSVVAGGTVTAYETSSVEYGGTCVSENRMCTNGTLSGTYRNPKCADKARITLSGLGDGCSYDIERQYNTTTYSGCAYHQWDNRHLTAQIVWDAQGNPSVTPGIGAPHDNIIHY